MLGQPFGDLWVKARWVRYSFAVGILVGVILGWMFHGVIAFVIRFGLIALFLVPLGAAIYFWWRLQRTAPPPVDPPRPRTLVTWQQVGPDADDLGELSGRRSRPGPRVVWDDLGDWADVDPPRRAVTPDHVDGAGRTVSRVPISGRVRPGAPARRDSAHDRPDDANVGHETVDGSGREA